MSIFEYDEERELALLRKDEYNAGLEAGTKVDREAVENLKIKRETSILSSLSAAPHSSYEYPRGKSVPK